MTLGQARSCKYRRSIFPLLNYDTEVAMESPIDRPLAQVDIDAFINRIAQLLGSCRPVDVRISCDNNNRCTVAPLQRNVQQTQVIRFHAKGTTAHVYIPDPALSATRFIVIPAGEYRTLPIAPTAQLNTSYEYVVYCETCGVSCHVGDPSHPEIIVE